MRRIIIPFFLFAMLACRQSLSRTEVEGQLKKAMRAYLYESVNNDSSVVKFEVKDVAFFEEKKYYRCEFSVRLLQPNKDTTGIMTADVTKDFKTVTRKY